MLNDPIMNKEISARLKDSEAILMCEISFPCGCTSGKVLINQDVLGLYCLCAYCTPQHLYHRIFFPIDFFPRSLSEKDFLFPVMNDNIHHVNTVQSPDSIIPNESTFCPIVEQLPE